MMTTKNGPKILKTTNTDGIATITNTDTVAGESITVFTKGQNVEIYYIPYGTNSTPHETKTWNEFIALESVTYNETEGTITFNVSDYMRTNNISCNNTITLRFVTPDEENNQNLGTNGTTPQGVRSTAGVFQSSSNIAKGEADISIDEYVGILSQASNTNETENSELTTNSNASVSDTTSSTTKANNETVTSETDKSLTQTELKEDEKIKTEAVSSEETKTDEVKARK
jgi:hypothetical protein